MKLKKAIPFLITAIVAIAAVYIIRGKQPPNTAEDVKKYIAEKGAENVLFSDFDKLPHRQREYTNSINIEYDLKDGNQLLLCGANTKTPYSIFLVYPDGRTEPLYIKE
ncbi:MAG: hypothetical protein IJK77_09680 [Lachnospiraceae bacterium]|nr:hypothetical protein [Lachnospiraceae bacterium]